MTPLAIGLSSIVVAVALAIVALLGRPAVALAIGAWLAVTGILATTGVLHVPRPFVLPPLFAGGTLLLLRRRRAVLDAVPRGALIALQTFRLPVELVLWRMCAAGVIPARMTFEGRNFDILVGLTAIPIALFAARRPRLALAWHVASLGLLVNVVSIAVASAPHIVGTFPFIWLPAFLVPVALLAHIGGIREVLRRRRAS